MEFKEFTLHPDLQRGIAEMGYVNCMPVQEQVLTHAFGGQDLYVQSQTGTGKTAAFLVVIFQRLLSEEFLAGKKALIMAPTRELAVQIEEEAKMLARYLPFKVGSFYGGVGYAGQERLLRDNVTIMVGTPGRVLDLNGSGKMNLMEIAFLVLDEADRMFDMGFYPDLRKLLKVVPATDRRQTMLFSATLNSWVKNLAWEYTKTPFEIEIEPKTVTVEEIDQVLYHVRSEEKMKVLLGILQKEQPESAIIFCNTKRYTEIIAKRLRMNGFDCEFIIGDLPQVKRLKVIEDLKAGKIRFLVATDVAARGLDIEALAMVVNYDLPNEAENYVHRIGRTARAGKTGRAITLASEQDVYELPAIERYIGKKIPSEIAGGEYHGEDASEGRRVQTDFYDDRPGSGRSRDREREPRSGRRGEGRRDEGRNAGRQGEGRRPSKDRRPSEDRRATGERRDEGGRDSGRRRSGNRNGTRDGQGTLPGSAGTNPPVRNKRDGTPLSESQDLSALSFEQRMSLYKEKYADGKPGGEGEKAVSGKGRRSGGGNGQRDRTSAEGNSGRNGSGRRGKRSGRRPETGKDQARRQDGKTGNRPSGSGNGTKTEAKKGFFSKLFGMFKKD